MEYVFAKVLTSSLSVEKVSYEEDSNIWIGPRLVSSVFSVTVTKTDAGWNEN